MEDSRRLGVQDGRSAIEVGCSVAGGCFVRSEIEWRRRKICASDSEAEGRWEEIGGSKRDVDLGGCVIAGEGESRG